MAANVHSAVAPLPICGSTANSATPTSPPAVAQGTVRQTVRPQEAQRQQVSSKGIASRWGCSATLDSEAQAGGRLATNHCASNGVDHHSPVMLAVVPRRPSTALSTLSAAAYSAHTLGAQ